MSQELRNCLTETQDSLASKNAATLGQAMNPTIERLPHAERQGDHHDRPLRWVVRFGTEVQKFPTRLDARLYAAIRSVAPDEPTAIRLYVQAS